MNKLGIIPKAQLAVLLIIISPGYVGEIFGQVQEAWSVPVSSLVGPRPHLSVDSWNNACLAGNNATEKYNAHGLKLWSVPILGSSLAVDNAGSIYVSGRDTNWNAGVFKLDAYDGHVLWQQVFPDWRGNQSSLVERDGNVYINSNTNDGILKLSANDGSLLWQIPSGQDMAIDSMGNLLTTDWQNTVKYARNTGTVLWQQPFGGSMAVDSADNVYVGGQYTYNHHYIVKLAANDGHVLWTRESFDYGEFKLFERAGNVYYLCNLAYGSPRFDKLNANNGDLLWSQQWGPTNTAVLQPAFDSNNNIYISTRLGTTKLDSSNGNYLWQQPIPLMGEMALDGTGNIYILSYGYGFGSSPRLAKYTQTGISSLAPASAVAGGTGFTLTVNGFGFSSNATVLWNGSPRATEYGSDTQLAAQILTSDISTITDISTAEVIVTNLDGSASSPKIFTIVSDNVGIFQSAGAGLGQVAAVSTAPTVAEQSGVTACTTNYGDPAPLSLTAANYATNPTSGTLFDAGSGFLDLQVTGADTNDIVSSWFYYPSTITGSAEEILTLLFFNGSGWEAVASSGGIQPAKDTDDNADGTVSGGRFYVVFDNTSTPKITDLTGTVFATVDGSKPVLGRISGPNGPIKKGDSATVTIAYMATGGAETHLLTVQWGDGLSDIITPTVYGTVNTGHLYASPGVYTVNVSLTDGNQLTANGKYEYVVVYDPDGGFVTGGGWINSPAGAYRINTALNGKATFGFNSRYTHGAQVPSGNTEFKLHFDSFNFRSTEYQWLVVAGAKAQYKGTGTVNGEGNYGFILTSTDGDLISKGSPDKFRIKIWEQASDTIIYDNVLNCPDAIENANPQTIGGGSIVIQKSQ